MTEQRLLSFKGDPEIWFEFTKIVKVRQSKIWSELSPLLVKYIEEKQRK